MLEQRLPISLKVVSASNFVVVTAVKNIFMNAAWIKIQCICILELFDSNVHIRELLWRHRGRIWELKLKPFGNSIKATSLWNNNLSYFLKLNSNKKCECKFEGRRKIIIVHNTNTIHTWMIHNRFKIKVVNYCILKWEALNIIFTND